MRTIRQEVERATYICANHDAQAELPLKTTFQEFFAARAYFTELRDVLHEKACLEKEL